MNHLTTITRVMPDFEEIELLRELEQNKDPLFIKHLSRVFAEIKEKAEILTTTDEEFFAIGAEAIKHTANIVMVYATMDEVAQTTKLALEFEPGETS